MMSARDMIADLDEALAENGETVILQRRVGTTNTFVSLSVRARLSGYEARDLVGGISQTDSSFILSPTQIVAGAGVWPGVAGGSKWPEVGDYLTVMGRQRAIEAVQPVVMNDVVVRLVGRVLG